LAPSYPAFVEAMQTLPAAEWPSGYIANDPQLIGMPVEPVSPERAAWAAQLLEDLPASAADGTPWWAAGLEPGQLDVAALGGPRTFTLDRPAGGAQ
jgi:hypothetical protein